MRYSCAGKWSVQTVLFCFVFVIKSFKLCRYELSNNMDIVKTKRGIHSVLNIFKIIISFTCYFSAKFDKKRQLERFVQ